VLARVCDSTRSISPYSSCTPFVFFQMITFSKIYSRSPIPRRKHPTSIFLLKNLFGIPRTVALRSCAWVPSPSSLFACLESQTENCLRILFCDSTGTSVRNKFLSSQKFFTTLPRSQASLLGSRCGFRFPDASATQHLLRVTK